MNDRTRAGRRSFLALTGAGAALLLAACAGAAAPTAAPTGAPAGARPAAPAEPTKPAAAGAAQPTAAAGASPAAAAPAAASTGKSIKMQQRDSSSEDFLRKKYGPE